jgi:predicted ATPase
LAKGEFLNTLSGLGGFADVLTRGTADRYMMFEFGFEYNDGSRFGYLVRINEEGPFFAVSDEKLVYGPNGRQEGEPVFESHGADISFQSADQAFHTIRRTVKAAESVLTDPYLPSTTNVIQFRGIATSSLSVRPFDVSEDAVVRRAQMFEPAVLPGAKGESLTSCLYSMRETSPEIFEVVVDTLAAAFPDFVGFELLPAAAGKIILGWKERGSDKPLYLHQLSDGTVRFLFLATLLASRRLPAVTLIDEPEASLHPDLLRLLVELMREASTRTQLIVATQSDRLVSFLEPRELLVADVDEANATFQWGDELDIDHWLKEYSLGDLWRTGVIGGRS